MVEDKSNKRWWTVRDLAERAGVTGSYIRLLLAQGVVQGEKINPRLWVIPNTEALRWLAARQPQGAKS